MKKLKVRLYDQYDPTSFNNVQARENDCWENVGGNNPELTIIFNATTVTPSKPLALYCCEPYRVMQYYNGSDMNKERLISSCHMEAVVGLYTYDKSLGGQHPKIKVVTPSTNTWVLEPDRKIYTKTKNLSMISSNKNYCSGHKKRLASIQRLMELDCGIGLYGDAAGNKIKKLHEKMLSHRDYRFSIVVENEAIPGWHTEKILDCFLTGTVPIYWGDPNISDIYDTRGILQMDEYLDSDPKSWTKESFDVFNENLYDSMYDHVKTNFQIAFEKAHEYSLHENINLICRDFMNGGDRVTKSK